MTEPCDLNAVDALAAMREGALSPVNLLESCLARIARVNPAVNAMVAIDAEAARGDALRAAARYAAGGPVPALLGLPLGVKDTHVTGGMRTTFGSPIFADFVPDADQALVRRLRNAGAIVLGKTNTPEWAAGGNTRNPVHGATGNAFDPALSSAGSSGGSAVALACGMVPICTGSDTGGSLRNPAAYNGIVGMRPSAGLVPSERRPLGWSCLSVDGPMARTVADTALLLGAMAGDDAADPLAYTLPDEAVRGDARRYAPIAPIDLGTLRLAATEDFGFAMTESVVRRAFNAKLPMVGRHFAHTAIASPDCTGADDAFAVLRASIFVGPHAQRYCEDASRYGPNMRANIEEALGYDLTDMTRALDTQTRIYRDYQRFFETCDVLVSPAITVSPRPWIELYPVEIDGAATRSYYHWLSLAYAVSLAGHPAISLPVGRDERGMPFGLQIVGRRGGDAALLRVAAALEKAFAGEPDLARPLPDLAALAAARPLAELPEFRAWG